MVATNRFSTCSSALELDRMELTDGTVDKMQAAVRTLIQGVGEDPTREGLLETPRVSARIYALCSILHIISVPRMPMCNCLRICRG